MVIVEFQIGPGKSAMALMLRKKKPLCETEITVITNSGLCVLKGLMGVLERGVYRGELLKKRVYWPTVVYGDEINAIVLKNR